MGKLPLCIAGAVTAVTVALFVYVTDAPAYLGTDPSTCNNCHVMQSQYENWYHGGHAHVTDCVDCHLPHDNVMHYYVAKAHTGLHDVYFFATGQTPALIRAKPETRTDIQSNCIRCHQSTVENILDGPQPFARWCWDCHRSVAHGQRGIALLPYQDSALYPVK